MNTKLVYIITNVNLQDAQPPEEVQDAFADAIKAREDEQRVINEAEAYRNEIIPKARGESARRLQEADAYKEQVIAQAEGETQRFDQLLKEYRKAPDITRERLYLEAMESVLSGSSKVLLDAQGSNSLMYLPLDKLINRPSTQTDSRSSLGDSLSSNLSLPSSTASSSSSRLRDTSRSREIRR